MLPALRLATSSLGGRKVRSGLLIAAVAGYLYAVQQGALCPNGPLGRC